VHAFVLVKFGFWIRPEKSNERLRSVRRIENCDCRAVIFDLARAFQVARIKVECRRDERFINARRVNLNNFFAELKRRNVYKVAIAYGVVAWLLMQVASHLKLLWELTLAHVVGPQIDDGYLHPVLYFARTKLVQQRSPLLVFFEIFGDMLRAAGVATDEGAAVAPAHI
jgi:hypothetical protein